MRSVLLSAAALLLGAAAPAAAAPYGTVRLLAAAAPPAVAAPSGSVRVLECTPALEEPGRTVTFEGRMRPIARSVTMAIRFTLQARRPDDVRWRRLDADGFDTWLASEPSVRRYSYAKTVRGLVAPASYRATVRFRWLDAAGHVIARFSAVSATCTQPDLRPDLVARRVDVQPEQEPDLRRYDVLVANAGAGASGASVLRLDVPGRAPATAAVAPLAPGESRTVSVVGPACAPGDTVSATVDPSGLLDEADEESNAVSALCPPPAVVLRPEGRLRGDG